MLKGGQQGPVRGAAGHRVSGPGSCIPGAIDCEMLVARRQTRSSRVGRRAPPAACAVRRHGRSRGAAIAHVGRGSARRRRRVRPAARACSAGADLTALSLFPFDPRLGALVDLRNLTAEATDAPRTLDRCSARRSPLARRLRRRRRSWSTPAARRQVRRGAGARHRSRRGPIPARDRRRRPARTRGSPPTSAGPDLLPRRRSATTAARSCTATRHSTSPGTRCAATGPRPATTSRVPAQRRRRQRHAHAPRTPHPPVPRRVGPRREPVASTAAAASTTAAPVDASCQFSNTTAPGPGADYPANGCPVAGTNQFHLELSGAGTARPNDVCLTDAQI